MSLLGLMLIALIVVWLFAWVSVCRFACSQGCCVCVFGLWWLLCFVGYSLVYVGLVVLVGLLVYD